MLVIYPFSIKDADQALKNAQWIAELDEYKSHDVFILADRRIELPFLKQVTDLFVPVFKVVQSRWTLSDIDGWPEGANMMFSLAATLIQHTKEWPYFLWLEPDAIPIRKGWLDELHEEYLRSKKPFMGEKVDLGEKRPDVPVHMSGVGFYQNPIYLLAGECYRAHEVAWDIAAKDQIMPHAHFTKKIQHYWKHGTFTNREGLRPETLIFHSSKDGSLIDVLRGREPVTHLAHNQETVGSIPTPAIKILPHNGIWVLEGDSIISDEVERYDRLDFDSLIPSVLSCIKPGDTVVDVGAFIGDHTVAYSHAVGKAGKVIAYEPNRLAFQCLVHNTDKCGNVFGFCHALGSERGELKLTNLKNAASNYLNGFDGDTIHVRPMDEDTSLFGQLNVIKIDVEGYELNVLKGAEQLINKFHPTMVVEINEIALERQNTTGQAVIEWICAHGYAVSVLHQHKDAPFYDVLALPNPPPEIPQDVVAHTPASSPVAPSRDEKELIKTLVLELKAQADSSPRLKAIVMQQLVYAKLKAPNKPAHRKRGAAPKERKTKRPVGLQAPTQVEAGK